jgi:hypothetical protein
MQIAAKRDKAVSLCAPVSALYEPYSPDEHPLSFSRHVNSPDQKGVKK